MAAKPAPAPAAAAAAAAPAKAGGSKTIIFIVAGVVLVAAAGGGAFWYARKTAQPAAAASGEKAEKAEKAEADEPEVERGMVSLEPFVVNLADPGGTRFLRAGVRLILSSPKTAEHLQKNEVSLTKARSTILELLSEQMADKLITVEGKAELKKEIIARLKEKLEGTKVIDVLFSEFVVQF